MAVSGVLLAIAAWPLAFLLAVFAGGGHGSPFGHTPAETTFGVGLLGVPALLLLVGLALIWASRSGNWRVPAGIALLIPIDAAITSAALWEMNRPEPPVAYTPVDNDAVLQTQPIMAVPACTPDNRCTTAPPRSAPIGEERH